MQGRLRPKGAKVFCFFFSKKKGLLAIRVRYVVLDPGHRPSTDRIAVSTTSRSDGGTRGRIDAVDDDMRMRLP